MMWLLLTIFWITAPADTLTIQQAYQQAQEAHPLGANKELNSRIGKLNAEIRQTGKWPVVMINGQATWQSEVTDFPVSSPGFQSPSLSKDQYKIGVDIQQSLLQPYRTGIQQQLEEGKAALNNQQTEVALYQVNSQVNQLYFGILLQQQRKASLQLLIEELNQQIKLTKSRIEQGVVLPGALYTLKAEKMQTLQQLDEVDSQSQSYRDMLTELTGNQRWNDERLELPELQMQVLEQHPTQRPERKLYEQRRELLDLEAQLTESKKWPEVSVFGSAYYGRPGFNFFKDDFHEFAMVGLKAQWNLWSLRNTKKEKKVIQLEQQQVSHEAAAFDQQIATAREEAMGRIRTAREQLKRDQQIVELRQKITRQTANQLDQGVVTTTDYISELRKEHQARLSRDLHQVQLQFAIANYATNMGITWYK